MKPPFGFMLLFSLITISINLPGESKKTTLSSIVLAPGFEISIYAYPVPGARSLAPGDRGTVFVGTRGKGLVYALQDKDHDNHAEKIQTIARGLNMPNGVAFRKGSLYVAEINRIIRFDDIENNLENPPAPVIIRDDFPGITHHGWKYIAFGPDGMLYVPIGAPCNVCVSKDERFATITRMNPDGTSFEIIARGVRNSVGFDWHPQTGNLWFTDNGRDWLGNTVPPDELNRLSSRGEHFGFPYCHGKKIPDPDYGKQKKCSDFTAPVQELDAHVAALGMKFYTGEMFPERYRNSVFIAEHGSWNRHPPHGYRIMLVTLKDGEPVSYEIFARGWLKGKNAWGRPVDILQMPDGSILVSDDRYGAVYRISYKGKG